MKADQRRNLLDSRASRRQVLTYATGVAGVIALGQVPSGATDPVPALSANPFTLGVSSGDPRPDGVVLWTRLATQPLADDGMGGMPRTPVPVRWEVAEDDGMRRVVRKGVATARPELAHAVHVEVNGVRQRRRPELHRGRGRHVGGRRPAQDGHLHAGGRPLRAPRRAPGARRLLPVRRGGQLG